MTNALIIVVPADWEKEDAVGISQHVFDTYEEELRGGGGMYIALIQADPVGQIVAQAELASGSHPADVSEWPGDNDVKLHDGSAADYVLPVKIKLAYGTPQPMLDTDLELFDEDKLMRDGFLPIDRTTYNLLIQDSDTTA